jgi:hypothetical protein
MSSVTTALADNCESPVFLRIAAKLSHARGG